MINLVTISGKLLNIKDSHTIKDEVFKKADVVLLDSTVVKIKYKEEFCPYFIGDDVSLEGNIRSFSTLNDQGRSKVDIYIFTYFDKPKEDFLNHVLMQGKICKIDRISHKGSEDYIHFILANNIISQAKNKKINCYIPCACKKDIIQDLNLDVNSSVEIVGKINHRLFNKRVNNELVECDAYEVEIQECKLIEL